MPQSKQTKAAEPAEEDCKPQLYKTATILLQASGFTL